MKTEKNSKENVALAIKKVVSDLMDRVMEKVLENAIQISKNSPKAISKTLELQSQV